MIVFKRLQILASVMALGVTSAATAEIIGGVNFPGGASSFADAVVSYTPPGGSSPSDAHRGAFNALGVPDYNNDPSCASQAACTFVSLGQGGSLVLRFTDNLLTGSDSNALDLWIFEVGPDVEATFVDVSSDGVTWNAVGRVSGSTSGIDLDFYGFGTSSTFAYVRLTDDPAVGGGGTTGGADIDAVGAISSIRTVATPPTLALALGALLMLGALRRTRGA